jgi:hypothetical protein
VPRILFKIEIEPERFAPLGLEQILYPAHQGGLPRLARAGNQADFPLPKMTFNIGQKATLDIGYFIHVIYIIAREYLKPISPYDQSASRQRRMGTPVSGSQPCSS